MDNNVLKSKIKDAHTLLFEESTSIAKFELIRNLLKDINPKIDILLEKCSNVLSDLGKLQEGKFIELTAENLPENTEKEKQRKKKLLLLLRLWNDLKKEVERVNEEFEEDNSTAQSMSNLLLKAKGPLGVITLSAVIIVGFIAFINAPKTQKEAVETNNTQIIKAIIVNDKKIPLDNVVVAEGPECDKEKHYHAKDHTSAIDIEGNVITDPGGCGFGKVKDTQVVEVEK